MTKTNIAHCAPRRTRPDRARAELRAVRYQIARLARTLAQVLEAQRPPQPTPARRFIGQ